MRTSLQKLSATYGIPYPDLKALVSQIDESILVRGKGTSVTIVDLEAFESAIQGATKRGELLKIDLVPVDVETPSDAVIEAEIVSNGIDSATLEYLRQLQDNRANIALAAADKGKQDGLSLGNIYAEEAIKAFINRKQATDQALMKLLGK